MFDTDTLWALGQSYKDSLIQSWAHTLSGNNEEVCQRIHSDSVAGAEMNIYTVQDAEEGQEHASVRINEAVNVKSSGGNVAVIPIVGAMQKDFSYYYKSTSTVNVIRNIQLANADPEVNSIVLYIDSGGGTVSGTYELGEAIRKSKKPILGAIADSCCSAALWAGSQTQFLYATSPTAGIGSIGVITSHQEISQLLDNIGVKIEFITSTGDEAKAYGNSVEPLSEEARGYITDRLNSTKQIFESTILRGRGERISDKNEAITAKVVSPKTAKNLGLIDGTMSLENVIIMANRQGKKYRREESSKRSNSNKSKKARVSSSSNSPLNKSANMSNTSRIDSLIEFVHVEEKTLSAAQLNKVESELADKEMYAKDLESKLAVAEASEKSLKEKLANAEEKASQLEETQASTVNTINSEKENLASELNDVKAKLIASEDEVTTLKADVSDKDTKIADLEAQLATANAEVEAAKTVEPPKETKADNDEESKEAKALKEMEAKMAEMRENYNALAAQVAEPEKKGADSKKSSDKTPKARKSLRQMSIQERLSFERNNRGQGRILTMGTIRNS